MTPESRRRHQKQAEDNEIKKTCMECDDEHMADPAVYAQLEFIIIMFTKFKQLRSFC